MVMGHRRFIANCQKWIRTNRGSNFLLSDSAEYSCIGKVHGMHGDPYVELVFLDSNKPLTHSQICIKYSVDRPKKGVILSC